METTLTAEETQGKSMAFAFGDLQKSMEVYHELEIMAMQNVFLQLNERIGGSVVAFRDPDWKRAAA